MEVLQLLEQKVASLLSILKDLKTTNNRLQAERDQLKMEHEELKAENAKLAEDNAQLSAKLHVLEQAASEGNDQVQELNQEKALTKKAVDELINSLGAVDDFIKNIDALVETEKQ